MANYRIFGTPEYGFFPQSPANGMSTFSLNAAGNWLAMSFVPAFDAATKQVAKVRLFCSSVTGTLGANDVTCDLYSDSAANPNASIESRNTLTSALGSNVYGEWTGFTATSTVTRGVPYWFVWKNVNGTPASNFPQLKFGGTLTWPVNAVGTGPGYGLGKAQTTNSGTSWTTLGGTCGLRVEYSDGTWQGAPITSIATSDSVYSARESGSQFVLPSGPTWNVVSMRLWLRTKAGTPAAGLKGKLYTGTGNPPTLLATTDIIPVSDVFNGNYYSVPFSAVQAIAGGTTLTATLAEDTNSDTSSNNYASTEYQIDNDANSKALCNGWRKAFYDGTNWTFTDTLMVPIGLELDPSNPFTVAGGGGLLRHPGMAGGMVA